jgi:murein DD-endopeptidase MepM/ murein hydrolase activator NlpD
LEPTPSQGALPVVYQKTAVLVDGKTCGVLASLQAATELLEEIKAYYVDGLRQNGARGEGGAAADIQAAFQSAVTLEPAADDAQTVTADALLQTLTASGTPLKVVCTVKSEQRESIAYKTRTESDKYLVAGTRIFESLGAQGERVTTSETVYVNGKKKSANTDTQTVREAQDALIRTGAQKVTATQEPGKSGGKKGPETALTFVSPIEGSVILNYGQSGGVLHLGLDYAPKSEDAAVVAACAGSVVCVMERGGYGLMVEIDHGGEPGFVTRYAHLSEAVVQVGQSVAQGEKIGVVGKSGNADAVQLHFELRIGGEAYNPRYYVNK